jgi:hypothetical protein
MDEKPIMLKPERLFNELYELLWLKPNRKFNNCFSFKIPDTILFKDNLPYVWIFTGKNGQIQRKHPDKLNMKHIHNKFFERTSGEIVANYSYIDIDKITLIPDEELSKENPLLFFFNHLGIEVNEENQVQKNQKVDKNKLKFEILNRDRFKEFMLNFNKVFGILQMYVESTFDPNIMFRVFWTEKKSICEMRSARQSFSIKNVHSYEKVVTFETERFNIQSSNSS